MFIFGSKSARGGMRIDFLRDRAPPASKLTLSLFYGSSLVMQC